MGFLPSCNSSLAINFLISCLIKSNILCLEDIYLVTFSQITFSQKNTYPTSTTFTKCKVIQQSATSSASLRNIGGTFIIVLKICRSFWTDISAVGWFSETLISRVCIAILRCQYNLATFRVNAWLVNSFRLFHSEKSRPTKAYPNFKSLWYSIVFFDFFRPRCFHCFDWNEEVEIYQQYSCKGTYLGGFFYHHSFRN